MERCSGRKGSGVNVDKTKGMQLSFGKKSSVSKVDPCGVCGELVGCNSIQCTKCQRWVHRSCSNVPRQVSLLSCWDIFVYRTYLHHNCSLVEKLEFKTGEDALEEVEKFFVEISAPKYVRSWGMKYQGKERRVDQGNHGKSA